MSVPLPPCSSLRTLQTCFLDVMTRPPTTESAIAARSDFVRVRDLAQLIHPNPPESAIERLAIYQRGYFARLVECLEDDYPALKHALGDAPFVALCRAYIVGHPSRHPNLNAFGRHLPTFMKESCPPYAGFVVELARLEWTLVECLHAPAPDSAPTCAMRRIPIERAESLRLLPNPSLRLCEFVFPVNDYLQAFYDGLSPELPIPRRTHLAVMRVGTAIWRLELSWTQVCVLNCLMQGAKLSEALADVVAPGEEVQRWFADWTNYGVVVDWNH